MNHRYRQAPPIRTRVSAPALVFALMLGGAAAPGAMAQRAGGLAAEVKSAPNAAPHAQVIQQFISSQVKNLTGAKDTTAQQRARDLLIRESSGGGAQPSASFLDLYATTLNKELIALAGSKDPRVRLNAAIVLQRVAAKANNGRLAEAAARYTQDPSFAVVLWAVKAARSILPAIAQAGQPQQAGKLPGAIVDAVQKNPRSGELVEEAYEGLTLGGGFRFINEQSVAMVSPHVLRLLGFRINQYAKETPARPDLETKAVRHLTLGRLWDTKEGAKLRPAIMQHIANLVGVAAQHAAGRDNANERRVFVETLQLAGEALELLGGRPDMAGSEFAAAGKSLRSLQIGMDPNEYTDRATAAFDAIKAKFPDTKPAPEVAPDAVLETEEQIYEEELESPADAKPGVAAGAGAGGTGSAAKAGAGAGSGGSTGTGGATTGGTNRTGTGTGKGAGAGTGTGAGTGGTGETRGTGAANGGNNAAPPPAPRR